jgi:hypothetical protein
MLSSMTVPRRQVVQSIHVMLMTPDLAPAEDEEDDESDEDDYTDDYDSE